MTALCFDCDAPAECEHHVVPRSMGGRRTVPLCEACHHKAHGRDGRGAWGKDLTRAALAAKKARGELTGKAPIGMMRGADGRTLAVDPGEAEAVAEIHRLRAEGVSIRRIAEELNARGVEARGGRWHATTVARVLARVKG